MDYSSAANCGIVDYELKKISVDYLGGEIRIDLISCSGKPVVMTIENFENISLQRKLPFGIGSYIAYSGCEKLSDDLRQVEIQLNSGDMIVITIAASKK